jgi:hypothetical protein
MEGGTVKKRSILIVLAVALLLVLVLAGTAQAYDLKAAPSLIDASCSMTWPDGTYTGYYSWHLEWSLDAGRPLLYRIEHYSSYHNTTSYSRYYPFTVDQVRAGSADIGPFYYAVDEGEGDIWRVQILSRPGLSDWTDPGWQS